MKKMITALLSAVLTFGVVFSPLVARALDIEAHCLVHQVEEHIASSDHVDNYHGVHHIDCEWTSDSRHLSIMPVSDSSDLIANSPIRYDIAPAFAPLVPTQTFLYQRGPPLSS